MDPALFAGMPSSNPKNDLSTVTTLFPYFLFGIFVYVVTL